MVYGCQSTEYFVRKRLVETEQSACPFLSVCVMVIGLMFWLAVEHGD